MALHYNLSKVYETSSNDAVFAQKILELFVQEVPSEIKKIKEGIKEKDYKKAYTSASKIRPTLDLLGMDLAFEEVNQVMDWANSQGKKKDIVEVYKLLKEHIDSSTKEIKKNHKIK